MKNLTKKQKTIQVQRDIKSHIKKNIEPKMMIEAQKMINDIEVNFELLESGNEDIKNQVIKNNLKN